MRTFETHQELQAALDDGTFRFLPAFGPAQFRCSDCKECKPLGGDGVGTGYGIADRNNPQFVCYACCGKREREAMIRTGKATLYLQHQNGGLNGTVTDWPGTLRFSCGVRIGRHNIAGRRYDVWFTGPDGAQWHGTQYGDNTQIVHCRRTKARA